MNADTTAESIVEPTWGMAARVWWAHTWRSILITMPLAILSGIVFGVAGGIFVTLLGADMMVFSMLSGLSGGILGVLTSIFVMKRILSKKFGTYRIVVLRQST